MPSHDEETKASFDAQRDISILLVTIDDGADISDVHTINGSLQCKYQYDLYSKLENFIWFKYYLGPQASQRSEKEMVDELL